MDDLAADVCNNRPRAHSLTGIMRANQSCWEGMKQTKFQTLCGYREFTQKASRPNKEPEKGKPGCRA
ncbi:hypothetical protein GCM10007927_39260 [Sulfitobacter pacificus]|uniref:Transposase n=1 Tax=Sulfitobacter pacificus TaxID=1499314 RepID=A0ABQ5VQ56_9RHOB|nr:hypothetical protein GCM10007927_39260 [Sulfitobacter pacificus]